MGTDTTTGHTVGVERLRDIPGYEHQHPMITAVVERHGSHVKVCATSIPVRGLEGQSLPTVTLRMAGSVRCAMSVVATKIAANYGAQFVGWAR